jgi:DNA-directed RNA polymerase subunit RPC12/RpoP
MKKKELIEIVKNNINLKPLTKEQEDFFKSKLVNLATTTRGKFHCLECGYKSLKSYSLLTENLSDTCPNCGKKIEVKNNKKIIFNDSYYGSIIKKFNNHIQVIRIFWIEKYATRHELSKYFISEVKQHWIEETGNNVYVCKPTLPFSNYCYDRWNFEALLRINNHYNSSVYGQKRFNISGYYIYPKKSIIPILRRNGFKKSFHKCNPQRLFTALLKNGMIETLFKAKQYQLIKYVLTDNYGYCYKNLKDNWNTVKICIRNKYIIKNPNDYFDHIELLRQFNKDIFNAYYVCPKDFHAEHQRYIKKEQKRIKTENLKKLINKINSDNIDYIKNKKRFFNLKLSTGKLKIMPVKSVKQLYDESSKLKHCAFSNSYHTKKNSLLLSAYYDNKLIETIEYDIKNFTIIQARGLENKISKYNTQIINLINNNILKFKNICQKKVKQSKILIH